MRGYLIICLLGLILAKSLAKPKTFIRQQRTPRLGPSVEEVSDNDLEPKLKILRKDQINAATKDIQARIDQINNRLGEEDEKAFLAECNDEDNPINMMDMMLGYKCECQVLEVKEVEFVEAVRCYKTTEEVCSMTQKTVFSAQKEKKCDTHFKKVCWIDYQEQTNSETVRICSQKPERKCDLSEEERAKFTNMTELQTHYETVCETRYTEKEVTEDRPVCENVVMTMCEDGVTDPDIGKNCMNFTRRDCRTEEITSLKAIPTTSCDQKVHNFEVSPACPLVVQNKVCQDVEKTFIANVPKETCELHPREVCRDIVKQYPSLQMETKCKHLPRETCSPERVQPKEITKPVIKKVCIPICSKEGMIQNPKVPGECCKENTKKVGHCEKDCKPPFIENPEKPGKCCLEESDTQGKCKKTTGANKGEIYSEFYQCYEQKDSSIDRVDWSEYILTEKLPYYPGQCDLIEKHWQANANGVIDGTSRTEPTSVHDCKTYCPECSSKCQKTIKPYKCTYDEDGQDDIPEGDRIEFVERHYLTGSSDDFETPDSTCQHEVVAFQQTKGNGQVVSGSYVTSNVTQTNCEFVPDCYSDEADAKCEFAEGKGVVYIKETRNGTDVWGEISGLTDGFHGFHVHEFGGLGNGCNDAGGHFDPNQTEDETGLYVGDLENVLSENGESFFQIPKLEIKVFGAEEFSVLNRAMVVHADPTGGARVMCCTIIQNLT